MSDSELNELRIRQMATLRRAAYRGRSYAIIGATACIVMAMQLIWTLIRSHRFNVWTIAFALVTVLSVWGTIYCIRRAIAMNREAKQSTMSEPTTPPDFLTLSDGSQLAKNLEEIE
ncbi:MAG TPA: hypothetical protein VGF52_06170 [Tepidisphaeraceae bacterium]